MAKKPRKRLERYMIVSIIYKTFSRFIIALTVALLWDRIVKSMMTLSVVFSFLTVLFLLFAWMAYLRKDGIHLPKIDRKLFERKAKPAIKYGDMIDYIDEEPNPLDELDEEEHELTAFYSNLISAAIFLILSVFF